MGGLVVVHQRVEQEEVVEERIVLCGWVVWCHCVVALRDVVLCHSIIVHGWWYIITVISEVGDRGVIIHGWWFVITIMW